MSSDPTSSEKVTSPGLSVFRDLTVDAPPPPGPDPDIFAAVAITVGAVVLTVLGLVGLVLNAIIRSMAGYDSVNPIVVVWVIRVVIGGAAIVAVASAIVALIRVRRTGGQRRAFVGGVLGLGWLAIAVFLLSVPGDAVREHGDLIGQGRSAIVDLRAGDCFKAITSERYTDADSTVYAIPCQYAHRIEVLYAFDLESTVDTEQEILATARRECGRQTKDAVATIGDSGHLVAMSPTQQGRGISGIGHVVCAMSYDSQRKGELVVDR